MMDSQPWKAPKAARTGSSSAACRLGNGWLNSLTVYGRPASREAGRPYTVSEFNQPFPNRQAAELDPVLAAFGAFQGWESIMHFAYSHGRSCDAAGPSSFDINGD